MKEMLPLGTVVALDEKERIKMVIAGYYLKKKDGKTYDYVGMLYPYGMAMENGTAPFNEENIKKVLKRGYETEKSRVFCETLPKLLSKEGEKMMGEIGEILRQHVGKGTEE